MERQVANQKIAGDEKGNNRNGQGAKDVVFTLTAGTLFVLTPDVVTKGIALRSSSNMCCKKKQEL